MSIMKKFKKSEYSHENLVKLSDTNIATDVKKMERYGLVEQGDVISAEDHNEIQHNGVIFSKPTYSLEGEISVYSLDDFIMEQEIFTGLKLKLLIDTDSVGDKLNLIIAGNTYEVEAKFLSENVYNLVYWNEKFIVEQSGGGSGGGLSKIISLWTGRQPFFESGDFMDITFSDILFPVKAGLLTIEVSIGEGLMDSVIVPVSCLEIGFNTSVPIYMGQSTGTFYMKFFREANSLRITNNVYTVYPQNAFITNISVVE